ncbi:hypothetical protein NGA_0707500 [Nannochloropsis gaditana CCMP526]|uniref:uncharacterized protein n=1 Tax=Nannochloropsis gaditana (strain CCMP526) TaxID=1093141 RepID=UPI00029F5579|nr:hypothetical protein NGA_0707500 [Nannochloropsis gaditana CCMP526]EKU23432.1 hypothetical protein NGA_0707500 [Nannochloropsis gaditana CCMP526]|eukprot:XP_005852401.1 hypothetical protein NGA_0707500 [Nannochloropsis gaditana CCMP526]
MSDRELFSDGFPCPTAYEEMQRKDKDNIINPFLLRRGKKKQRPVDVFGRALGGYSTFAILPK